MTIGAVLSRTTKKRSTLLLYRPTRRDLVALGVSGIGGIGVLKFVHYGLL